MEILTGRIRRAEPDGVWIRVDMTAGQAARLCTKATDEVAVGFRDGRTISPEQRRKAWALMTDLGRYIGCEKDDVYDDARHDWLMSRKEELNQQAFRLSQASVTQAREFIDYLIGLILRLGCPVSRPLYEMAEDIPRYVYRCAMEGQCCVCQRKAEIHHLDRVGMGRSRKRIEHIGLRCLPLCRMHHMEAHQHGDGPLMNKYHLEPILIDAKIAAKYKLGTKGEQSELSVEDSPERAPETRSPRP